MLLILKVLAFIALIVCLGFIAYWMMAVIKGDAAFRMEKTKRSKLQVDSMGMKEVNLSFSVPLKNVGKQLGTIMDAFPRVYLPFEQYDEAVVSARLTDFDTPRPDDYWQAYIVEPGKAKRFLVHLTIEGKSGNILRDMETFPELPIDIIYQIVARSDYYYAKTRIVISKEEIQNALYTYTQGEGK